MGKRSVSRRRFLQTAAVGTAAATSGAIGFVAVETQARSPGQAGHHGGHGAGHGLARPLADHTEDAIGLQFFGRHQAATVQAWAARIIPTDELGPGAKEAGVIHYIDRALAGAYDAQQPAYYRGLIALDAYANERFGANFVDLAPQQQDAIIGDVEAGRAPGFSAPAAREFFNMLWRHTMEGFLGDPMYGGNQDFIGWKLVNFPGAIGFYTPQELVADYPLDKPFVSMQDWTRPF
jgi:gluconate 2-dehydrogenase gamma chain